MATLRERLAGSLADITIDEADPTPAALWVEDLSLVRNGRTVLQGISFDLQPGEIVGVIGPNGAGKSFLLETIAGLHQPTQGRLRYGSEPLDVSGRSKVLSFVSDHQQPPAEAQVDALLAKAYREDGGAVPEVNRDPLHLRALGSLRVAELSRGEKRRVALFLALSSARPIAILDDPLAALDSFQGQEIRRLLRMRANAGGGLLISAHQLTDTEEIADRILVLDRGRVVAFGTLSELGVWADREGGTLEDIFLRLMREADAFA